MKPDINELVTRMFAGSHISLACLISAVERESPDVPEILEMITPHLGKAYCIGITGPPGGGKSTLVDKLAAVTRRRGLSVGIVAVDPSSPISGGALLGDRIRMQQHYLDDEVFIRSMATRGSHGGLSKAVQATVNLLDAFGKDIIMIETVGVGQTETNIIEIADTVVLVLVPESGDAIQVMKAGLIEVADIIVVNKADHEGAERLVTELQDTLIFDGKRAKQSIMVTQAINDIGIEELYQELDKCHRVC
ncbi:methylmalonyl Co-A mutase-associated GTPase MeaB [Chloroflexota bacterium]